MPRYTTCRTARSQNILNYKNMIILMNKFIINIKATLLAVILRAAS